MANRRDQLHSYQFMSQRVIAAFVMRETDPAQSPLRRGIGALFGGLMIAVLIGAVFGVIGILKGTGAATWKTDGSVIVEQETGASFVYLDDRLHPALNLASAKLAGGQANPAVNRVAAKSLAEVPRGVTIGIPGAPDSLPASTQQAGLPWTMCAVAGSQTSSVLLVGTGGPAAAALGERGVLVKDVNAGPNYLIWHGLKFLVQDARSTLVALFGAPTAIPVSTAWLNALPSGNDIVAVQVDDRGSSSAAVPGRRNGDVLVAQTASGNQYYLVLDDGLAPITPLQQAVLAARFPAAPISVTVNSTTQVPPSKHLGQGSAATRLPDTAPKLVTVDAGQTLCATTKDATQPPVLAVGGSSASLAGAVPTAGATGTSHSLADGVLVPPGKVEVLRVPGSGDYALVTDLGVRYAVSSSDALGMLGYEAASAVTVPNALISTIPAGVNLDPAAAGRAAAIAN